MTSTRSWALAGVVTGATGVAASQMVASLLSARESPLVAVAEGVVRATPGPLASQAIDVLGSAAKPLLVGVIVVALLVLFALAGWLWPRRTWASVLVWLGLGATGMVAVALRNGTAAAEVLPIVVGVTVWLVALQVFAVVLGRDSAVAAGPSDPSEPSVASAGPAAGRRGFLATVAAVGLLGACSGVTAQLLERRKAAVLDRRRLLRIPGVTQRTTPARARIGVPGVTPWRTANDDFYRIHTALAVPAIDPAEWRLRIHGMVEREIELSFDQLIARNIQESWVTLNCVSNEVGGSLIGNAWWSGVMTRDLLREAGPLPGADAVLQTSDDGWTCSTPLEAMTDDRGAMIAVAMNGEPLPLEHGFPARTLVPGLYGYTSACKWVVDLEVTRFSDVEAYWTARGWAEQAPVRLASRIDVPRPGAEVASGRVTVAGVAWHQTIGIAEVQVSVDGGAWTPGRIASPSTDSTWVQWAADVKVDAGDHVVRVRAVDRAGEVQTGVERDPLPNGASGWHEVSFTAVDEDPI
ncbi:molybdopterin-dependent oxidoreductase [Nocardioides jishulii]|uniref:Oxidoreductase n=1 Tax=Nocardioides jishulii TaxID=2575440 RepID=A0A4U2YIE9_9ACTN|nr:molybdopterin-dependent oxidoreductase [Nocardioides jishulii]QCX26597.1 oxidoreductase [Nocardioides jishulii]TKI60434.1 oxidoreductase [Nocardioides jishulii]